jgi:CheY-like chemotaxis protein/HPt (histidine-containing phosphotransfer) domain-containing protein
VESQVGEGSTFWFELPLGAVKDSAPATRARSLAGRRVLVVDDNQTNREVLTTMLMDWKMDPYTVESAHAAWNVLQQSLAEEEHFDLAILDWHMPDVDGVTLARRMNDEPGLASIPRIMLSSASVRDVIAQHSDHLFAAFISKPVRLGRLRECLMGLLAPDAPDSSPKPGPGGGLKPTISGKPLRGSRLLLVEDNRVNQEVYRLMLEAAGAEVRIAADGDRALEALESQLPDLVLMDCQMPVRDGFSTAAEWRRREAERGSESLPIIALTANALREDHDRCLESGMNDYLAKPCSQNELLTRVAQWLPRREELTFAELEKQHGGERGEEMGDLPLLDAAALQSVRELGGEDGDTLMENLLALFREESVRLVGDMESAVAADDDRESITLAAHTLKSSAWNVGAMRLGALAQAMEIRAKTQGGAELETLAKEVRVVLDATIDELFPERVEQRAVGRP